jgi:hypothetical protein
MSDFASWFGLCAGKEDFYVLTDRDYQLYFARSALDDKLRRLIDESNRGNNTIKAVLYGDWGAGKTHTLRHLKHQLESNNIKPGKVVLIDLPDISTKSKFNDLQFELLDGIGFEDARDWVKQFNTRHSDAEKRIKAFSGSSDITKAILTLPTYGDSAQVAWSWLRGLNIGGEGRSVGLPAVISQSKTFTTILRLFGMLCLDCEQKRLTYMIDEADKLENISDADAQNQWIECVKELADISNDECGIVFTAGFTDIDSLPRMLREQQVQTRFTQGHYLALLPFGIPETMEFLKSLFAAWIDPTQRTALLHAHASEADGETLTPDSFPFTEEGLDLFANHLCRSSVTRPRDIQAELHTAINYAVDANRRIMSTAFLNSCPW